MSDTVEISSVSISSTSSLFQILKNCANFQSYDSLPIEEYNDVFSIDSHSNIYLDTYPKMIATNTYSISGSISNRSASSDDSWLDNNILEESGRISLAYENLKTIPRRIAEKYAMQTKFLDLSYNNFQNLSFLSFFEDLHTLILDRNSNLDVNSLPFLPNLKILWINNCNIKNVVDWIHRIRTQCPTLEHLSIMGNPGIKEPFNYCTLNMYATAISALNTGDIDTLIMPANSVVDYREYILGMLTNLQYLDGTPRHTLLNTTDKINANGHIPSSPTTSLSNGSSSQSQCSNNGKSRSNERQRKISTTLSFKGIFRMKRRKSSYPSSSTN
uniref:U2A'/phosphoprotein 32 family A C-terminal domain-containing protein n=1 Tax=Glossina brevipalpis TaxID=37001 RepID=A0A1A9W5A0_9MUSC